MSSIGGLSSSIGGSSSIRGYGGMASGLDRDSLIEGMTKGTVTKIQKQQQAKQKIAWRQEAMRGITDKLYAFSQNFMSYTSSKSLLSSKLYMNSTITALGDNSKFITATGNTTTAGSMSVVGVKQMASDAKANFKHDASNQILSSAAVGQDMTATDQYSTVAETGFTVKYGSRYYSVHLPESGDGYSYDTAAEVAESINKALKEVSIGNDKSLGDAINVTADGNRLVFKDTDAAGNKIVLAGESYGVLQKLGFDLGEKGIELSDGSGEVKGSRDAVLKETKTLAEQLGGKQVAFSYNGKTEWITLADADALSADTAKGLDTLVSDLQTKLDKAFGKGRIQVGAGTFQADGTFTAGNELSFRTVKKDAAGTLVADNSSVFSVSSAERGVLGGNGAIKGIEAGDSNRLNLDASLSKSGLVRGANFDGTQKLKINGVEIETNENSTLREIMDAINKNEEAGVKISYLTEADRFVITSTENGASGDVKIEGDLGEILFGAEGTDYEVEKGRDAVVFVKYDGSDKAVEITRDSNTFNINGLTITAKGTFGDYDSVTGEPIQNADHVYEGEVSFDVTMDTQPAVDAIKEMVEAYNEIVKLVNDEVSTKPNRSYEPLTSEQEDDMSESEIERWNEKAKEGLLFNDSDVRGLADALRSIISSDSTAMKKLGITVSSSYADNGKLEFDEVTFKTALASDPDGVIDAFTRAAGKNSPEDKGGLMTRMQTTMNKYASVTGAVKGILIERAGSKYAPTSILTNSMQKQMDEIDDVIDRLLDRLDMEQDRYISQFTTLESLISQMNSQSSWLQSAMG